MYGHMTTIFTFDILDRMVEAVERVRERLARAAAALDRARIPYAVAGGNAVASWVARIDAGAVRNTQAVDILIRRSDMPAAKAALESAGFVYRHAAGTHGRPGRLSDLISRRAPTGICGRRRARASS